VSTRIVSASAGSGKTHRLAEELKDALSRPQGSDGCVMPEQVLATTFTNKAAAELQERARRHLLEQGRAEDAQRLAAARIGTVNAVCGRLVSDFAFELGLPPDQRVLDEQAAKVTLRRALSTVISVGESLELAELDERLPYFAALDAVQRVIELARANRIDPSRFDEFATSGQREIEGLLDGARESAANLDDALLDGLRSFQASVQAGDDKTQVTAEALERAGKAIVQLQAHRPLSWDEWAALAKLKTGARSRDAVERVHHAAARYLEHPSFHADLARVAQLVFDLARRGLGAYSEHKRAAGVVDFVDQETKALELLERDDVCERLRGELGLVLVDEFQDTSPLQLAIFLRFGALAPRSLWVGDQKQSIFAFRGSDPELMRAAMDSLLDGASPETLEQSWRSRPELVHLTSDLFARAFGRHGLPEDRVRLRPAERLAREPEGLGPIVERWRLQAKNQQQDPAVLAAAVQQLLADDTARVRDQAGGNVGLPRPVRPSDIAILCRRNSMARDVAAALGNAGLRAVVPSSGLLATPEGQIALAGLRLWADPKGRLAAATIARLSELPADGTQWLEAVLTLPKAQAFLEMPRVRRLLARREELLAARPTEALDAILESLDVRSLCADWGDTSRRLANLDALRAHATVFAEASLADGAGGTVLSLVSHLEALQKAGVDDQATLSTEDAVVVSTWHAAKGLEWPIVVLFELDADKDPSMFGVSIARDDSPFDALRPLEGRGIRLWPMIFQGSRKKTEFHDRLAGHPIAQRMRDRRDSEELRLLYVGWTRARDRIILAARPTRLLDGILRHLNDATGCLIDDPEDGLSAWAGRRVEVKQRRADLGEAQPPDRRPGQIYAAAGPKEHPPAWAQPSAAGGVGTGGTVGSVGTVEEVERFGPRLELRGTWDEQRMGEVFHRFLAADDLALETSVRLKIAQELVDRWDVTQNVAGGELVKASDRLWAWLDRRWPGARCRREWPVWQRIEGGTVLHGSVDLAIEAEDELAIVDHKSFPGAEAPALERAIGFAGQLQGYASALGAAEEKRIGGTFIHLPVSGLAVRVHWAEPGRRPVEGSGMRPGAKSRL
jgi:ATP-dependent helicase/nuclease subunit A